MAPAPPCWLRRAWQERGASLTVAVDPPVKARHGRFERRILWALADPAQNARPGDAGTAGQPRPHVRRICRIERRRVCQRTGETAAGVSHAVTSRPAKRADAHDLLAFARGHWAIENQPHHARDVAFDGDRSQVRTGAAPRALAACRNLTIALPRRRHAANLAAALRSCARSPRLAARLVLSADARR